MTVYEWERESYRDALRRMTEMDRMHAADEPRRSLGIVGDPEDAIYE